MSSEPRSTFVGYLWRGAIGADSAEAIMSAAEESLAGREHHVPSSMVFDLAASSRLSAYDCEFVALADALGVPLVTEDRAVLKAFPDVAISMEAFLARFQAAPPSAHQKRKRYRSG